MTIAGTGELDVVLLHGAGLAPATFEPLMAALRDTNPALEPVAPLRHPYRDGGGPFASVDDEAEALVRSEVDGRHDPHRPCVVVGVSGGATLALSIAARRHPSIRAVIAHEPLVGPRAPELHAAITASADQLLGDDAPLADRVEAFLHRLVGTDAWAALPPDVRQFGRDHAAIVVGEVPRFTAFAPDPGVLRRAARDLTITTGGCSHERRHAAAAVLASLGAVTEVIDGAGHLVHWDAPAAFASAITGAIGRAA